MIICRQLMAGVAALWLAHISGKAAYVPMVQAKSERDAFVLKVGYATFDSIAEARSQWAFSNLTERLKTICHESRSSRTNEQAHTRWKRRISFDLALGSDYQVLNWLQTAQIDVAMICPLTLHFQNQWYPRAAELVCLSSPSGGECMSPYQPRLRSLKRVNNRWQPQPNPESDYHSFLQSIAGANPPNSSKTRLIAPSHFSAAGFLVPVDYANQWLRNAAAAQSLIESNFWERFFGQLEFSLGRRAETRSADDGTLLIEFSSDLPGHSTNSDGWRTFTNTTHLALPWLTNFLVVRKAVSKELNASAVGSPVPTAPDPVVEALCANPFLKPYLRPQFTIPELVHLLHADQKSSEHEELALVLSGGGVKAAYQTALIDHLYSERLLSNSLGDSNSHSSSTNLLVKTIVGNSGGALLGFFVAALDQTNSRSLSTNLWRPDGKKPLTDRQIFGFMDLPRWASFVVCIWFFIFVVRVGAWLRTALPRVFGEVSAYLRTKALIRPTPDLRPVTPYSLARLLGLWIFGVLALIPLLLKVVNGPFGSEHVPPIQGFFYFACLCAVLLIDNCVTPTRGTVAAVRRLSVQTVMLAVSIITILVPLVCRKQNWVTELVRIDLLDEEITRGAIIFCLGMLLFWAGVVWNLWKSKDRCVFAIRDFAVGTILGILIVLLVYACLLMLVAANQVTFLELTARFWCWLIPLTVVISTACFCLGIRSACPDFLKQTPLEALYRFLHRGLTFHLAKHPNGAFGLTRFARMHLVFTAGFVYWNLLMAPGIYGNGRARTYLYNAYVAFTNQAPYRLQTLYAAPANDLEADRERYFLYHPERAELSTTIASLTNKFKHDARNRWSVYPSSEGDLYMRQVVFASGSPFPIFSPHKVEPKKGARPEWLVDGGYAHNIPLEAAREIGARQVLLLNSSPADEIQTTERRFETAEHTLFGQLSRNIPRLFPFLFNRSQVADLLIREQMFIVSLSPQPDRKWPPLFDFRQKAVEYLLAVARADTLKRIGRIESCGPPVFRLTVRMGSDRTEQPTDLTVTGTD